MFGALLLCFPFQVTVPPPDGSLANCPVQIRAGGHNGGWRGDRFGVLPPPPPGGPASGQSLVVHPQGPPDGRDSYPDRGDHRGWLRLRLFWMTWGLHGGPGAAGNVGLLHDRGYL